MDESLLFLLFCVVFGGWVYLVNCFLGIWFDSSSEVTLFASFVLALVLWMAGLFGVMAYEGRRKDD